MSVFCLFLPTSWLRIVSALGFSVLSFATMNVAVADTSGLLWAPALLERSAEREKEFQAFNAWLSTQTGERLSLVLEPDYDQLMQRFEQDKLAMVWVGPQLLQQIIKRRPDVKVLATTRDEQGKTDYHCALFVRQDYERTDSAALQESVALAQPLSTCGSIGARMLSEQSHVDLSQVNGRFTGSHQNAIVSVMLGETASGIVAASVYDRFSWLPLKRLLLSDPLPSFMWLVNPRMVSPEQQQRLRFALSQAKSAESVDHWYGAFRYGFETNEEVVSQSISSVVRSVR